MYLKKFWTCLSLILNAAWPLHPFLLTKQTEASNIKMNQSYCHFKISSDSSSFNFCTKDRSSVESMMSDANEKFNYFSYVQSCFFCHYLFDFIHLLSKSGKDEHQALLLCLEKCQCKTYLVNKLFSAITIFKKIKLWKYIQTWGKGDTKLN